MFFLYTYVYTYTTYVHFHVYFLCIIITAYNKAFWLHSSNKIKCKLSYIFYEK